MLLSRANTLLLVAILFCCLSCPGTRAYSDVSIVETEEEKAIRKQYYSRHWNFYYDRLLEDVSLELQDAIKSANHALVEKHFIEANISLEERKEHDGFVICSLARMAIIENGNLDIASLIIRIGFNIVHDHWQSTYQEKLPKDLPMCVRGLVKDFMYARDIFSKLKDPDANIYFYIPTRERLFHKAARDENWFIVDVLAMRLVKDGRWEPKNHRDLDDLSVLHILSAGTYAKPVEEFLKVNYIRRMINDTVKQSSNFRPGFTALHFANQRCRMTVAGVLRDYGAYGRNNALKFEADNTICSLKYTDMQDQWKREYNDRNKMKPRVSSDESHAD